MRGRRVYVRHRLPSEEHPCPTEPKKYRRRTTIRPTYRRTGGPDDRRCGGPNCRRATERPRAILVRAAAPGPLLGGGTASPGPAALLRRCARRAVPAGGRSDRAGLHVHAPARPARLRRPAPGGAGRGRGPPADGTDRRRACGVPRGHPVVGDHRAGPRGHHPGGAGGAGVGREPAHGLRRPVRRGGAGRADDPVRFDAAHHLARRPAPQSAPRRDRPPVLRGRRELAVGGRRGWLGAVARARPGHARQVGAGRAASGP